MAIYVETFIRADLEQVWRYTQTPELHARWDVRFSDIRYLPRANDSEPRRFLYETRIGFGLRIRGEGETTATRPASDGARTSSLRFWSDDPISLIREGSGYWQYVPRAGGVRFLTRYHYSTRFGAAGRTFNALVFEPLMARATAWSFDRLRLWLEEGLDPDLALQRSVVQAAARWGLAAAWLYQGLVPKLLYPATGETQAVRRAGVARGRERLLVRAIGGGEMLLGAAFVARPRARPLFGLNALLLAVLGTGAARTPTLFRAPFNPVSLTATMLALAAIGAATDGEWPRASRCNWTDGGPPGA